jgi:putative heme iron utilization protein
VIVVNAREANSATLLDAMATPHETLKSLVDESFVASLAVKDQDEPAVSLVAFTPVWSPFRVHLFVSELSSHTPALRAYPLCSLMIHASPSKDDPQSNHALTRVIVKARAHFLSRDEARERGALARWQKKYPITDMLAGLSDFQFVELEPIEATFIMGFGRAYKCTGPDLEAMQHQGKR